MKILCKSLLLVSLIAAPGLAWTGTVTSTVNFVQVNRDTDRAYIKFTEAPTSSPDCATDVRMTIDLTTDVGRAMFTMAITAKASDRILYAAGTGTCTSKYENVNYMRLL
ncbi:MAG: hypothetical protein PVI92_10215 [Chromatiales bacterium]|jgi:hypothetical protein